jgi:hypothetical protein
MAVKLKTKLTAGLVFLFTVILIFGILGTINIDRLSRDADLILKDNYKSILYCNSMLKALETVGIRKDALDKFGSKKRTGRNYCERSWKRH